jgi:hypothetical protein
MELLAVFATQTLPLGSKATEAGEEILAVMVFAVSCACGGL